MFLCTAGFVILVFQNYEKEENAKVQPRFFNVSELPQMIALNLLLFFTVVLSNCHDVVMVIFKKICTSRCYPVVLGLCCVCIQLIGISLKDFRIIHIMSTSSSLRCTMGVGDVVSILLRQAMQTAVN